MLVKTDKKHLVALVVEQGIDAVGGQRIVRCLLRKVAVYMHRTGVQQVHSSTICADKQRILPHHLQRCDGIYARKVWTKLARKNVVGVYPVVESAQIDRPVAHGNSSEASRGQLIVQVVGNLPLARQTMQTRFGGHP